MQRRDIVRLFLLPLLVLFVWPVAAILWALGLTTRPSWDHPSPGHLDGPPGRPWWGVLVSYRTPKWTWPDPKWSWSLGGLVIMSDRFSPLPVNREDRSEWLEILTHEYVHLRQAEDRAVEGFLVGGLAALVSWDITGLAAWPVLWVVWPLVQPNARARAAGDDVREHESLRDQLGTLHARAHAFFDAACNLRTFDGTESQKNAYCDASEPLEKALAEAAKELARARAAGDDVRELLAALSPAELLTRLGYAVEDAGIVPAGRLLLVRGAV